MAISEERRKVLQMVEEGKLSPEDGARLLAALGQAEEPVQEAVPPAQEPGMNGRYFRVRVTNGMTGQQKVSVNIPLGIVDFGLRFIPENNKFDAASFRDAIRSGMTGRIVDVMDDEKGDRVEVFIE